MRGSLIPAILSLRDFSHRSITDRHSRTEPIDVRCIARGDSCRARGVAVSPGLSSSGSGLL